jgi:hypothetical protein
MPDFVFAYHGGGKPATKEEGEKAMAAWTAWFGKMGAAVVDGGKPVGKSYTVSKKGVADNGGANPISGYSVVRAKDITAAIEMAKGCPMLQDGSGTVEVAEAMNM